MSWIIWLIIIIVLLPGFCFGIMFTPFAFDDPYGNPFEQLFSVICIPILMSVALPVLGLISLICWIFRIH